MTDMLDDTYFMQSVLVSEWAAIKYICVMETDLFIYLCDFVDRVFT